MSNTASPRPRAVFMGRGPVAAASLELLLEWCDIEAVITKPQPPHHREKFPVITVAEAHDLPLVTVSNKRELDDAVASRHFESRLAVLIDFGIIVSQQTIDSFELGIVNSHFSLLPEWRGADPITFSILSGQSRTGVSLMLLVQAMDEGPLLAFGVYDLDGTETTPQLTQGLIALSDGLLKVELPRYLAGDAQLFEQADIPQRVPAELDYPAQPSYSRKLSKDDSLLDFTKPAAQLEREVRAFVEWPKSRMELAGKDVVITKARCQPYEADMQSAAIGAVHALPDKAIGVKTSSGLFVIERLKPAGKPEMDSAGFLAGNKL